MFRHISTNNISLKNIGYHSKKAHKQELLNSTEKFITNLRWRAGFKLGYYTANDDEERRETYGLKSKKKPGKIPELANFEHDLLNLVANVTYREKEEKTTFSQNFSDTMKRIKDSPDILVKADKSSNVYATDPKNYKKIMTEKITTSYKKAPKDYITKINDGIQRVASNYNVLDRIQKVKMESPFITVKDHKPEARFMAGKETRLLNPMKSDLGIIAKKKLDNYLETLKKQCVDLKLFKNSDDSITWFDSLENKNKGKAFTFDIVDFYNSISLELFQNAWAWLCTITTVNPDDKELIIESCKSMLYHNDSLYLKKSGEEFEVTMGSHHGAEVCMLIGYYLLSKIQELDLPMKVGLFRDDALVFVKGKSARIADQARQKIQKCLAKEKLKITHEAPGHIVNFLDVVFDFKEGTHSVYTKPNNEILYVDRNSNHPPSVIKQIPSSVTNRLSKLSSSKQQFNKSVSPYKVALKSSGYSESTCEYEDQSKKVKKRKTRRQKVTWFNPPYTQSCKTSIGHEVLKLIDKHFARNKTLKFLNRSTVKISYRTMPNLKSAISAHNKRILKNATEDQTERAPTTTKDPKRNQDLCSCRDKAKCPVDGKCLDINVIYEAKVETTEAIAVYNGLAATDFKARYNNHMSDIRRPSSKGTTLSTYVKELDENKKDYTITWKIIDHAQPYNGKCCRLCERERYHIMFSNRNPEGKRLIILNKRSEILTGCRHMKSYYFRVDKK